MLACRGEGGQSLVVRGGRENAAHSAGGARRCGQRRLCGKLNAKCNGTHPTCCSVVVPYTRPLVVHAAHVPDVSEYVPDVS